MKDSLGTRLISRCIEKAGADGGDLSRRELGMAGNANHPRRQFAGHFQVKRRQVLKSRVRVAAQSPPASPLHAGAIEAGKRVLDAVFWHQSIQGHRYPPIANALLQPYPRDGEPLSLFTHDRAKLSNLCIESGQRRKPNRRGIFGDTVVAAPQDGGSLIAKIAKPAHGGYSLRKFAIGRDDRPSLADA